MSPDNAFPQTLTTDSPALLLVDDDPDLRESLRLEFADRGYDVWERRYRET